MVPTQEFFAPGGPLAHEGTLYTSAMRGCDWDPLVVSGASRLSTGQTVRVARHGATRQHGGHAWGAPSDVAGRKPGRDCRAGASAGGGRRSDGRPVGAGGRARGGRGGAGSVPS